MRFLLACEYSGRIRRALRELGHDAWSYDLLDSEDGSPFHVKGDVRQALRDGWDAMIAHPPCTYLTSSGLHWNSRRPGRAQKTDEAIEFVAELWAAPIKKKAIENPQGCINTRLPYMPRPQFVQPYEFGDDASKKTGFWIDGFPPLVPTKRIAGRIVICNGKEVERWSNQTDSGQNKLSPGPDRWKDRSRTYPGIAAAIAQQWGGRA